MDFTLSKSHQLLQNLYRQFAETEIRPIAREMDETETFSMELLEKMKRCGFFGIPYPKKYGGAEADILAYALCMEEISKVDASSGITISVHTSLCCASIYENGTEEQKQTFLRPLVDGTKIGCFALTEPNAGSDVSGLQTSAVRDGDDYILNGSKVFTTNSGFADTMVVFAITDKAMGTDGISAFIVDTKTAGLHISANIPRMGIRAASNCEVSFQNTKFKLAEMQTKIDAARLMVWRAAVDKDSHRDYSASAAMCKLFASDVANEVTRICVQLLGGYGYSREYPVERMMRDAKITEIYEGTSEVMKMVISGSMKVR